MEPNQICEKCKKNIESKEFLKCINCGCAFDVDCTTNVSIARFRLMTLENKNDWKCHKCHRQGHKNITARKQQPSRLLDSEKSSPTIVLKTKATVLVSSNTDQNKPSCSSKKPASEKETTNITIRKKKKSSTLNKDSPLNLGSKIGSSAISCTSSLSPLSDLSSRSMPDPSTGIEIEELKYEMETLKCQLQSADLEIENLLSENYSLKKTISEQNLKITHLKKICLDPVSSTQKSKSLKKKKKNEQHNTALNTSCFELGLHQDMVLEDAVEKLNIDLQDTKDTDSEKKNEMSQKVEITNEREPREETKKICLISSDSRRKTLSTALQKWDSFSICHHLTPGVGIQELFNGIDTKLKDFTLNDYCIIFIGDLDFKSTNNYVKLVDLIQNKLRSVQHTNVILCLPTFKLGKNLFFFNKRIEAFNAHLYSINLKYKYAYILDSNRNLQYSRNMFMSSNGSLNNRGLRVIFDDLVNLIKNIESQTETDDQLFRQ